MIEHLKKLQQLRGAMAVHLVADVGFAVRLKAVKAWQQARLRRTYADMAADARFRPAVRFFLDELYGMKDSTVRDKDLMRMYPTIKRLLPQFAFEAVERALALDVLAEEFDQALTTLLGPAVLNEENYLLAFRRLGRREDRLRQIALMRSVGEGLDRMVAKPLIFTTLKLLRRPAKMAGLAAMQAFLEAGFTAFRHMQGADYFLNTIAERETLLIERILDGELDPFAVILRWNTGKK